MKKTTYFLIFLSITILILQLATLYTNDKKQDFLGRIIFRRNSSDTNAPYEMLISDGTGKTAPQWLGFYRGSPAWSPDGKFLAVGCNEDVPRICILNTPDVVERTSDWSVFPVKETNQLPMAQKKLEVPIQCQKITSTKGFESISWSFDIKKLAVVCGDIENIHKERLVCIIPIESGKSTCWDPLSQHLSIYRANWSPKEDLLLISSTIGYGVKIYTIKPDGKSPIYLTDGWGAAWSPDGQQIAFIQWQNQFYKLEDGKIKITEGINQYTGLGIINKDGGGMRWLYRNPENASNMAEVMALGCDGMRNVCKITWSPDGRYIAFSGSNLGMYNFQIFRLEISTGRIIYLTNYQDGSAKGNKFNAEPDWGK